MGLVGLGSGLLRTFFGPKIKQPKPPPPPPPRLALPPGFKPPVSLKPPTPPPQKQPAPPRPNLLANLAIDMGSMYAMNALTAPTMPTPYAAPVASTVPAAPAMGVPAPQTGQLGLDTTLGMDPRTAYAMREQFGSPGLSASLVPPAAILGGSGTPIGVQSPLGDPTPLAHLRGAPAGPLRPWQTPSVPPAPVAPLSTQRAAPMGGPPPLMGDHLTAAAGITPPAGWFYDPARRVFVNSAYPTQTATIEEMSGATGAARKMGAYGG